MDLYNCIIILSLLRKVLTDILVSVPKMWPKEIIHKCSMLICTSETDKISFGTKTSSF